MRLPFLVVILFLLPPHSITFSLRRTPTLSVPNAPPLPPLFTRAYDLLSTGNFLFDRISPTLRSTEATFRGLYSYTNTLDQESRSDSAAIIRLGINVTESISSLSKFQRLAMNTMKDAESTRNIYNEIIEQRKETELQTRKMCSMLHKTLNQWTVYQQSLKIGKTSLIDISTLPTGHVNPIKMRVGTPELEDAIDVIKQIRQLSKKRLRSATTKPMKKSSPPPPPSPPLVFPEKAMNALMYKLCDDTVSSSILYGINRLNHTWQIVLQHLN